MHNNRMVFFWPKMFFLQQINQEHLFKMKKKEIRSWAHFINRYCHFEEHILSEIKKKVPEQISFILFQIECKLHWIVSYICSAPIALRTISLNGHPLHLTFLHKHIESHAFNLPIKMKEIYYFSSCFYYSRLL